MNKFLAIIFLGFWIFNFAEAGTYKDRKYKFKSLLALGSVIKKGDPKVIFLNFGALLHEAKLVADELNLTLIDMRFIKPLDEEILRTYLKSADIFISLEDGSIAGGAGSAVQEFCSKENIYIKSKLFGIPDNFVEHASREEMIEECGLTSKQILAELETMMER